MARKRNLDWKGRELAMEAAGRGIMAGAQRQPAVLAMAGQVGLGCRARAEQGRAIWVFGEGGGRGCLSARAYASSLCGILAKIVSNVERDNRVA